MFCQHSDHDVPDPIDHVVGPECPSDSDAEGALTNVAPVALPPHSSDRVKTESTPNVRAASKDEELQGRMESHDHLTTKGGGRGHLRTTHCDVLSAFSAR